ncbi:MAG: phosphotransferase [Lachnospiraceae bacterium]|nr:phosphotransferase [Lachnospiraceae bacterium]
MALDNCLSKGTLKSVYLDQDTILKVFEKEYPKAEVLYEALNTARVEDTGLSIPKILEVTQIEGKWAIRREYVEGKTLYELMQEKPKDVDKYLEKMVDMQIKIQSKRNPLLNKLKDKIQRQIQELDCINEAQKFDLEAKLQGMPKHNKLCHGDYEPKNIIVDKKGNLHVVDWVHASQGNASADVARTYLLLALDSKKNADKYLDLFCNKTGTDKKYVQQWLPIVAAAQLEKNRPEEKDLLFSWVDVFDYQ